MPSSLPKPFDVSAPATEFEQHQLAAFWQRRMLELHALCRLLDEECAISSSSESLSDMYARFKLASRGRRNVLRSPALLSWIYVARYFVMRGMHRSLPQGHIKDHINDFARFAFAAAHGSGLPDEAAVRVHADGRIPLPGLGMVLTVGQEHAGEVISLRTDGNCLTAILGSTHFNTSTEPVLPQINGAVFTPGWYQLPRLAWGLILDDSAELVRPHSKNNSKWKVKMPDEFRVTEWFERTMQACELISLVEDSLFVPVRAVLSAIVPLEAPPEKNLSATTNEVLGCICTSLPAERGLLAETLVHEAAHTTLHIASDVVSYWNAAENQLYQSPWRKDLRPISGIVHGIVAFIAVGEFWSRLLTADIAHNHESLARSRLSAVVLQLHNAIEQISDSSELTDNGRHLVGSLTDKLKELEEISETHNPPSEESRRTLETQRRHDHSFSDCTLPHPKVDRVDPVWSKQLGISMPPPINYRDDRVLRRELISDKIHLLAARGDALVREWQSISRKTEESEPESTSFVMGSLCYGSGDFSNAINWYSRYVERRWEDVDAWRLLAAALRRTGRHDDALLIAFNLEQLQRLGSIEVLASYGGEWWAQLAQVVSTAVQLKHTDV
jgi:HEXXH motif-containing protein